MQDKNNQNTEKNSEETKAKAAGIISQVAEQIEKADSILVALSKDPSVDEMAAAIGLTLMLDKIGKHVTAIYSGKTPNTLEFLKPEETFETNTNSLQDFIIALDKEKADHLRYKIEGDFVKVYITPYKTTISENDLEFSHGDVNVDLVISIDVTSTEELDAALAEHGRIMHDASSINVSNGVPGKLGGIEWNDAKASSVSEMMVNLADELKQEISTEAATAFLTGVIAATERFSNEKTAPETMAVSAKLMQAGADQQLITTQMEEAAAASADEGSDGDVDGATNGGSANGVKDGADGAADEAVEMPEILNIAKEQPDAAAAAPVAEVAPVADASVETAATSAEQQLEQMISGSAAASSTPIMEELATATPEATVTSAETTPDLTEVTPVVNEAVKPESDIENMVAAVPTAQVPVDSIYTAPADQTVLEDGTVATPENIEVPKDYGAMMEEALAEPVQNPAIAVAPEVPVTPEVPVAAVAPEAPVGPEVPTEQSVDEMVNQMVSQAQQAQVAPVEAPAAAEVIPETTATAEAPQGGVEIPPPPAPVIDTTMPPVEPSLPPVATEVMPGATATPDAAAMAPAVSETVEGDDSAAQGIPAVPAGEQQVVPEEPVNPVVVQPVTDPTLVPPVQDPGAFKIPGM